MNTQMPHFEWSEDDKARLQVGCTVVAYWELGVTHVTLYSEGRHYFDDEEAKIQVGPNKYKTLAHCDPKTLKGPDDNKAT